MSLISLICKLIGECACIERFLRHPRSALRFSFFFFLRHARNAATGFHEDRITQCPRPSTLTNDLGSLELSCGRHGRKRLLPPLLLERLDCERPKPEGRPSCRGQSDPKATDSLRRENS